MRVNHFKHFSVRGWKQNNDAVTAHFEITNNLWLIRHSGRLLDQEADQAPQQRLTPLSDVVNELEESQVQG